MGAVCWRTSGFSRVQRRRLARVLAPLRRQIVQLQGAGHILGSADIQVEIGQGAAAQRVVFSGDLGAPYTPLLPAPQPPLAADVVVLESTYGNRVHEARKTRRQRLQALCEHAFSHAGGQPGTVLIPAFSIGRTQELLCELEDIIHRNRQRPVAPGVNWGDISIVVDSPLAADFTKGYSRLKARIFESSGRRSQQPGRQRPPPAGLRAGEVGGGPARAAHIPIRAQVHTLSGYSAHADQADLLNFVTRIRRPPRQVRLVHGDEDAKATLGRLLRRRLPGVEVVVP